MGLWHVRWTTLGLLLWLLWITLSGASALADCTTSEPLPAHRSESSFPEKIGFDAQDPEPGLVRTLAPVGVVLVIGIATLVWLMRDGYYRLERGQALLATARADPTLIERVDLHDGECVFLRITLKGIGSAALVGLSPVESVRAFDHLKSIAPAAASFHIVGGASQAVPETNWPSREEPL